jgi:hypothetical protein
MSRAVIAAIARAMAIASSGRLYPRSIVPVVVVAPMCDIVQQLAVQFPRVTVVGKGRAWPGTQRYHDVIVTTGAVIIDESHSRGAETSIA